MKTRTIQKEILELDSKKVEKNLFDSFMECINDYANYYENSDGDIRDVIQQVYSFLVVLNHIKQDNWGKIFSEGYTMMALDNNEMNFIDKHFANLVENNSKDKELEIHIMKDGSCFQKIFENYIDY